VTPPEAILQLEQQRATIERLEKEVVTAQERLKLEKFENETRSAEEKRSKEIAQQAELLKRDKAQIEHRAETANRQIADPAQQLPVIATVTASRQSGYITTDREQTLYRSAVTAYKIGDCVESIKMFDAFTKIFPDSPFADDASSYRKDCSNRLATTAQ
jgi:TolA-binding protein